MGEEEAQTAATDLLLCCCYSLAAPLNCCCIEFGGFFRGGYRMHIKKCPLKTPEPNKYDLTAFCVNMYTIVAWNMILLVLGTFFIYKPTHKLHANPWESYVARQKCCSIIQWVTLCLLTPYLSFPEWGLRPSCTLVQWVIAINLLHLICHRAVATLSGSACHTMLIPVTHTLLSHVSVKLLLGFSTRWKLCQRNQTSSVGKGHWRFLPYLQAGFGELSVNGVRKVTSQKCGCSRSKTWKHTSGKRDQRSK